MPPRLGRHDDYAAHRCPKCGHLKYPDERPEDPCLASVVYDPPRCNCTEHTSPAAQAKAAAATAFVAFCWLAVHLSQAAVLVAGMAAAAIGERVS